MWPFDRKKTKQQAASKEAATALAEEQQKALLVQIPLGHLGKPSDVAHAVVYLASPQAAYVTGQELHVNGGMFMA